MNTNQLNWMRDMHKQDTMAPAEGLEGEIVYTIYLADFMNMPDVNFVEVAAVDANVRSLLN